VDLAQRPEMKQKVTLSPQVYQGLNILAMPVAELQAMIEQELLENPVLELDSLDEAPEDEAEEERVDEGTEEERAWDDWLDQYEDLDDREPVVPRDPNEEAVNTEEFVGAIVSFEAYLLEQLSLLDIDDEVEHAARIVIGSLDGDGLLVASSAEIAAVAGVGPGIASTSCNGSTPRVSEPATSPRRSRSRCASSVSRSRFSSASSTNICRMWRPTTIGRSHGRSTWTRERSDGSSGS
jgi:DNA-directed RNA polymerase specialized sigma54-like protein